MSLVKKILLITAIIFFLLIAGITIFLFQLDMNDYKDTIAEKFQEETGYVLQLQGNLDHSLYPWLGLAAEGIVVVDPKSTEQEPLFQVKTVKVRAKLLPLFF